MHSSSVSALNYGAEVGNGCGKERLEYVTVQVGDRINQDHPTAHVFFGQAVYHAA